MVSGAVVAGIGATEGLFPHAFDRWLGLSGNWALLVGGFALIITLIVNPEGIAGTGWKKKQQKKKRRLARPGADAPLAPGDPAGGKGARLLPSSRRRASRSPSAACARSTRSTWRSPRAGSSG